MERRLSKLKPGERLKRKEEKVKERLSSIKMPEMHLPKIHMPHARAIFRTLGFAGLLAFAYLFVDSGMAGKTMDGIKHGVRELVVAALEDDNGTEYTKVEHEEFEKWAKGGGYGSKKRKAGGGKSLSDILNKYNENNVESGMGPSVATSLSDNLAREKSYPIEGFEIVKTPSRNQIAQLELLREYMGLATGVEVDNDLFIFEGRGALGINMGGAGIGMHMEMLKVDFDEALKTFIHEVSHNEEMGHDIGFIHMDEALETAARESLKEIAEKMDAREKLTKEERRLLKLEAEWDRLRG